MAQFLLTWTVLLHSVLALHCHRKHDHSSDILLKSDATNGADDGVKYLHSMSDTYYSERLVQEPPGLPESVRHNNYLQNGQAGLKHNNQRSLVSFCPGECSCNFTSQNQLQVICTGFFSQSFPFKKLRSDVEILRIEPKNYCYNQNSPKSFCGTENSLSIGPNLKHLRQLKSLTIRRSGIPNIGYRTLWGLSSLEVIDLSYNKLETIVETNFDMLYSLKELYLNNNNIKSIVSAAFRLATRIEILSLANNKLEEVATRTFYKLVNLKELDLSGNRLQFIDGAIFVDIKALEVFKCDGCSLFQFKLPDMFTLVHLHTLSLAHNAIRHLYDLHPNLLKTIQHLNLEDNNLAEIEAFDLQESTVLKTLDVKNNNISVVQDCAFCYTAIQRLDFSFNRMRSLNPQFISDDVRSLSEFYVSGNYLDIPNIELILSRMPNLEKVGLDQTGLPSVPTGMFYNNPRLREVNVSGNYLVNFDESIVYSLKNLAVLDLSHNYLMGMDAGLKDALLSYKSDQLKMVYLQHNPFVCDKCHIRPLVEYLELSLHYWGTCENKSADLCLKCHQPDEVLHLPVEDLKHHGIPKCQDVEQALPVPFNSMNNPEITRSHYYESGGGANLESLAASATYVAAGVLSVFVIFLLILGIVKYRHYGVYLTHEEDQLVDGEEVLRNPVVVLDKNSESYINLKYPLHHQDLMDNNSPATSRMLNNSNGGAKK